LTEEQLKALFAKYDTDGSGSIEPSELPALLESSVKQKLPAKLLEKYHELQMNNADKDKNGIIDFNEFVRLYKQLTIDPELPIKLQAPKKSSSVQLETGEDSPKVVRAGPSELTEEEKAAAIAAFKETDADNSGSIDKAELTVLLKGKLGKKMGEKMIERYVDSQFQLHDKDGSGSIDETEFLELYAKLILHKGETGPARAGSVKMPPMF
jgi:Ca2+-binding EF-hand superfamily protein